MAWFVFKPVSIGILKKKKTHILDFIVFVIIFGKGYFYKISILSKLGPDRSRSTLVFKDQLVTLLNIEVP